MGADVGEAESWGAGVLVGVGVEVGAGVLVGLGLGLGTAAGNGAQPAMKSTAEIRNIRVFRVICLIDACQPDQQRYKNPATRKGTISYKNISTQQVCQSPRKI